MLAELISNVGIPGIDKLDHRNKLYSGFWLLLILGGVGFCGFHLSERFKTFLRKPVLVNLKTEGTDDHTFPAVDVCTTNQLSIVKPSKCSLISLAYFWRPFRTRQLDENRTVHAEAVIANCPHVEFARSDWLLNWTRANVKPFRDVVTECVFDDKECPLDTYQPRHGPRGICYRFNRKGAMKSASHGIESGLSLVLGGNAFGEVGRFFLGVDSFDRISLEAHAPVFVPEGMLTAIALKRHISITLPEPYPSKCREYKPSSGITSDNSKDNCIALCNYRQVDKLLGCHMVWDNNSTYRDPRLPYCNFTRFGTWLFTLDQTRLRLTKSCRARCPEACHKVSFKVKQMSQMSYRPSEIGTEGSTRLKASDVLLYLEDGDTDIYQQVPAYTWLAFLSDIGGAISLVLGACLLTVVQLLDTVIMYVLGRRLTCNLRRTLRLCLRCPKRHKTIVVLPRAENRVI